MDVIIIIVGIFIAGAAAGVMVVIGLGIHREEQRLRDERELRDSEGGPDAFITDEPADRLSGGTRLLTGLYARHAPPQPALGEDLFV